MTTFTMLIGFPAAGKSTLRELIRGGAFVASSDDFIERMAADEGKTYNECFQKYIEPATKHFDHMVSHAVSQNKDLIVDRTNLTRQSRYRVLTRIPFAWHRRAVVVKALDEEAWKVRLRSRPGKFIPEDVVSGMVSRFEHPELDEGFNEILVYHT